MKHLGITAEIFRSGYKCRLNKFDDINKVVVPTNDGVFDPTEDRPAVKLVKRNIYGSEYIHAEPAIKEDGEWFAFGGSFIYCSDSRFPSKYPIPLHDRRMNLEK